MKAIKDMAAQRGFEYKALSTPEEAKGILGFKSAEVVADNATYKIIAAKSEKNIIIEVIIDGWSEKEWTVKTQKAAAEEIRKAEWLANYKKEQKQS